MNFRLEVIVQLISFKCVQFFLSSLFVCFALSAG